MNYYLGVDAGGSKTYTLIADETGRIVGKGASGNGNHQTGYEEAKRNITASVEEALAAANVKREQITFACFGLAGADREIDYRILRPLIAGLGFPHYEITGDTMIAMRAGTDRPYGVVLICGTGTNSAGKNPQGTFYQCGGFSYLFGDFAGGGTLAREAFRSVIRAWDGREQPTKLTGLLLERLGYQTVQAMFDDYLDHEKAVPIDVARLVFQAAQDVDAVAERLLRIQGEELGVAARAVIDRLGMSGEAFDVVLAGSIVTRGQGSFVLDPIEAAVKAAAPAARIVRLQTEPVIGALWLAFEADGQPLPEQVYEKLRTVSEYSAISIS
ncbi:N-acetylglucosamine kinase-like BadF-type ATPase [Paenibacillus phyllosphaerae]|uniref:N-acetylglucosamine kinase-like BadF-type ATPase n=1 Tax=Paenibacillus phyllosphaerae TaxID=274593 RepID=A0A7W5FN40_9BACL|nr:BadF/BadG/BcrA/BcrD ATPase family protein [Paenibacillus phyllosphaerae]MBB3110742.1 N-acetylglucosamine kinase-like BadF-type ATPase [Paenibacillus phyllosphaerae]